ncbi:MAG: glycosyltransferase [Acidobacteria bacterium]|nr:glycosyltransferase [Acidobacteriota bacterium]
MASERECKVSVIIPTWKRGDLLRKCLESLRRQSFSDFEIMIVSNGAGEWAVQLAREFGCKMVHFPENRGFAAAVNAGVAASKSQYVAVLNDDAELEPGWLEQCVVLLEGQPGISFCCGKIYTIHSNKPGVIPKFRLAGAEESALPAPGEKQIPPPRQARARNDSDSGGAVVDDAGDALSMGGGAWRLGNGRADAAEFDGPRQLFASSMTAAIFRRTVFEKIGNLDENFISYLEDIDFSIRAWRAGFRGMYLPQAVAQHHSGASLEAGGQGRESQARFELMTRNQLLLLTKHYPAALLLRLAARILWAQALWLAMALRKGLLGAYAAGVWQYMCLLHSCLLPQYIRKRTPWSKSERRAFLNWLRESERAIYEDVSSRPRPEQDTYWRMYFALYRPRRSSGASGVVPLQRIDEEEKQQADPSSVKRSAGSFRSSG